MAHICIRSLQVSARIVSSTSSVPQLSCLSHQRPQPLILHQRPLSAMSESDAEWKAFVSPPATGNTDIPPFHHAFPVHDVEAARQFYGGVLGLALTPTTGGCTGFPCLVVWRLFEVTLLELTLCFAGMLLLRFFNITLIG
eukprot:m.15655 g.15655  ORF g.15655 m.15655 type:complete len:140 (+) comp7892_c0_seq1:91-510(+)